ncbi:hypothetical protein [Hyphococcus sp.]|uniref:hypothetical protein n=1 Tax=Hyphococcus sp. TaxID=2038636 RepID=UPI00207EE63D|nr:MAG: hypothetical protein DHS20C04_30760 [Marinicaulis sp.]
MTIITLPQDPIRWKTSGFGIVRADAVSEKLNGARQVTQYPKALWVCRIDLPPLFDKDNARRSWRAALVQLSKLGNTCELSPPDAQMGISTGYSGSAPSVAGADQLGLSLDMDGVTPSATIARAGEYFHIVAAGVKELKMLTADLVADGSGEMTAAFEPALRNAPADDSTVEIFAPKTAFALATPEAQWQNSIDGYSSFSIEFVEAFS